MVSNLAGGSSPQHGAEPGTQLGALEAYAAQAHGYLSVGGEQLNQLPGLLRPMVLESWLRTLRGGVDPLDDNDGRGLRGTDLERYRVAHPIAAVMPLVDKLLLRDATSTGLMVVVADQFGRVLSVHGNPDRVQAAAEAGLREGNDLSERRVGTNAVGLVVRTGRAAWIHGPEHFLQRMHQITGAAAPVHDPDGRLVGVLMIAGGVRVARPEILALVKAAATAAEMDLLLAAVRSGHDRRSADAPIPERLGLEVLGLGQPQLTVAGSGCRSRSGMPRSCCCWPNIPRDCRPIIWRCCSMTPIWTTLRFGLRCRACDRWSAPMSSVPARIVCGSRSPRMWRRCGPPWTPGTSIRRCGSTLARRCRVRTLLEL